VVLCLSNVLTFGVDLMPMSMPSSKLQPRYALVVLDGDKVVSRFENVSRMKLIRLLWKFKPSMIAIDNVYEFASSNSKLIRFFRYLPEGVKIIQVTRVLGGFKPLPLLARDYGLYDGGGKLNPIMAAELSARLAILGVGSEVSYLKGETRILVCRGRRIGEGGMSEDRYERKIRTSVYNVAMNIKSTLDSEGFEYDVFFNKRGFGIDRCLFIVYASKDSLGSLIKNIDLGDVQIRVFEESSQKILFKPIGESKSNITSGREHLIIGLDPGIITGLAIIDLDGKLLYVNSKRNWSRNDIISEIMKFGDPILIATDVHPPSSFVVKMASILGAKIAEFGRSLSISEKREIISRYVEDCNLNLDLNVHEKDALSAALKAFYGFKTLFSKAEAHALELGFEGSHKALRALLIKGYNIKQAIEMLMELKSPKESVEIEVENSSVKSSLDNKVIEDLKRRLSLEEEKVKNISLQRDELMLEVSKLKAEIERLNSILNAMSNELNYKLKKDREIASLELRLNELQSHYLNIKSECETLRSKVENWHNFFLSVIKGEIIVLKYVKNLTVDDVNNSIRTYNICRGDVVFISDFSIFEVEALKKLLDVGCSCIIGFSPPKHVSEAFEDLEIPFIDASSIQLKFFEGYPYVNANVLKDSLIKARNELMEKSSIKRREKFKQLFDEYRKMRLKELEKLDSPL